MWQLVAGGAVLAVALTPVVLLTQDRLVSAEQRLFAADQPGRLSPSVPSSVCPGSTEGSHALRQYHRRTTLTDVTFTHGDFKCAVFTDARLRNVTFDGVHLIGADFNGAVLDNVTFKDGELLSISFRDAKLRDVAFRGVLINSYAFEEAREVEGVELEDARCIPFDRREESSTDPCAGLRRP